MEKTYRGWQEWTEPGEQREYTEPMPLLAEDGTLKALQDKGDFTQLMVAQEELKTLPFGEVFDEYCRRCGKPADGEWFPVIAAYEKEVLEARK